MIFNNKKIKVAIFCSDYKAGPTDYVAFLTSDLHTVYLAD